MKKTIIDPAAWGSIAKPADVKVLLVDDEEEEEEKKRYCFTEAERLENEALKCEDEAVAVRIRNEARALQAVERAQQELIERQRELVERQVKLMDAQQSIYKNILRLSEYQGEIRERRVFLSDRTLVTVGEALAAGWRPTTPEAEDYEAVRPGGPSRVKESRKVKQSAQRLPLRNTPAQSSVTTAVHRPSQETGKSATRVSSVTALHAAAVLDPAPGAVVQEALSKRVFTEKSSWSELSTRPLLEVHDLMVKKFKASAKWLRVEETTLSDEACALEYVKQQKKRLELTKPFIQARREARAETLTLAARLGTQASGGGKAKRKKVVESSEEESDGHGNKTQKR
jgi:hypothetical protein